MKRSNWQKPLLVITALFLTAGSSFARKPGAIFGRMPEPLAGLTFVFAILLCILANRFIKRWWENAQKEKTVDLLSGSVAKRWQEVSKKLETPADA